MQNRHSVCLAYWAYMCGWHVGGVTDRDRVRHRVLSNGLMDTIGAQLRRVQFRPAVNQSTEPEQFEDEEAVEIYWGLVEKYEGAELVPDQWRTIRTALPIHPLSDGALWH